MEETGVDLAFLEVVFFLRERRGVGLGTGEGAVSGAAAVALSEEEFMTAEAADPVSGAAPEGGVFTAAEGVETEFETASEAGAVAEASAALGSEAAHPEAASKPKPKPTRMIMAREPKQSIRNQ